MRKPLLIACLFLASTSLVLSNEWPVYFPAMISDPVTPTPAATHTPGNGVLKKNRIAPNEKIITAATLPEQWTIEFLENGQIKLTSDRTGYEGTFLNTNKSRSNSGRLVLIPKSPATPGTPVIVENTPRPGDKFIFTVEQPAQKNENFMTLFGDYNANPDVEYWHGAMDVRVLGAPNIAAPASIYPVRDGTVRHVDKNGMKWQWRCMELRVSTISILMLKISRSSRVKPLLHQDPMQPGLQVM